MLAGRCGATLSCVVLAACNFDGATPSAADAMVNGDATANDAATASDGAPSDAGFTGLTACPDDQGVIGCYLFDGDSSDRSSLGNNGIATNIDFVAGVAGQAAQFSNNDRLDVPANEAYNVVTEFSIEAWLYIDSFPNDPSPDERAAIIDVNGQWSLFLENNGGGFCSGRGSVRLPADSLPIGRWFHLACSRNSLALRIYIDGALVDQVQPNQLTLATQPVRSMDIEVGSDASYSADDGHFIGLMDNLLIWDTARSNAEICQTSGACDM